MPLSHWRLINRVELLVLLSLLLAGLSILLLPLNLQVITRVGLSLGLFTGTTTLSLQLHTNLGQRQWNRFKRRLTAFFLSYCLNWFLFGDFLESGSNKVATPSQAKSRSWEDWQWVMFRERSKQMLTLLNIFDQSLYELVDHVTSARDSDDLSKTIVEINDRVVCLLTRTEIHYHEFWLDFQRSAYAINDLTRRDMKEDDQAATKDLIERVDGLMTSVETVLNDRNPYISRFLLETIGDIAARVKNRGLHELFAVTTVLESLATASLLAKTQMFDTWTRLVADPDAKSTVRKVHGHWKLDPAHQ